MIIMADSHNVPFFGQNTGMILSTPSKEDNFVFIKCIKKKNNCEWEKFNEGKTVKISLMELIAISDVLNKKDNRKMWSAFHSFNNVKTPISFKWDENDEGLLWIIIDGYTRAITYPETELMKKIIDHIMEEKICFATQGKLPESKSN